MDADIQFGDLEESRPEVQLRPDQNKHYAVVPFEAPRENDLPIFVDLDVMRDMETHALEDTTVELGGVLLGGQYEDEDGNEFVVVTDSLRAQHYEATKGSFKFTHDTWEQISRERDEFPDELQMVGWYHTHPDWGVFLSGMDMFICDNFFNKPLDLALVIDPCRGDRGMFMWTGNPSDRIRRTGGFYFMASRHRRQELEMFTCQLEGKLTMPDSRFNPVAGHVGSSAAPIVNLNDSRNNWQAVAIVGMLTVQFLVLCLIAFKLIVPVAEDEDAKEKADHLAKIEDKIELMSENIIAQEAQEKLLDDIVSQLEGGTKIVDRVKEYEVMQRKAINDADESQRVAQILRDKLETATELANRRKKGYESMKEKHDQKEIDLLALQKEHDKAIKDHEALMETYKNLVNEKGVSTEGSQLILYITAGVGAAILLVIVGVVFVAMNRRDEEDEYDDEEMEFKETVEKKDEPEDGPTENDDEE